MSDSMNDQEIQKIPEGSVITEEMIEEVREASKLTDENGLPCNRDVAIGTLSAFEAGNGQPSTELFAKFPTLAAAYYNAIAKKNQTQETGEGELSQEKAPEAPAEEAAPAEAPAADGAAS